MDDSGRIKIFTAEELKNGEHKRQGYHHELNEKQAEEYSAQPQEDRMMWLAWDKYFDALDLRIDTIKKLEMRKQFFAGYKTAKGEP